jgi:hypothetical protein
MRLFSKVERRILRRGTALAWVAGAVFAAGLCRGDAQTVVSKEPRITAVSPLSLPSGGKTTLRILGVNLGTARQLVFPGTDLPPVSIPARQAAELPKGLEMKEAGETQFDVTVDVPQGLPGGRLPLAVQCASARSVSVALPVRDATAQVAEQEPNNGTITARNIAGYRQVSGTISGPTDFDYFKVTLARRSHLEFDAEAPDFPIYSDGLGIQLLSPTAAVLFAGAIAGLAWTRRRNSR